ncbi:hypothetical protein EST38_g9450 [Candolleomyces aberdarensis]|uniref:Uncharacterized protein n=1 Tax=Candolleomyces aberdarensis TaxID=2316362 RepID=A0A4Q2D9V9_9AGAR|nr:hypothetical protein EST38_g9450 [Candolleomyces aberdarensis]
MALRPGIYRIETVPLRPGPPPDLAVGIEQNSPVRAFPLHHPVPPQGIQEWRVAPVHDQADQYTIISPGFHPIPRGWGCEDNSMPEEPVLLTDITKHWVIKKRPENDTYVFVRLPSFLFRPN